MKGIKNSITKESFSKSTLKGIIRKGFITDKDLDNTSLTQHTKSIITHYLDSGLSFDLYFVRDKQVLFILDNKNKVVYDCQSSLGQYLDYFVSKNQDYKVEKLDNVHPLDLRKRGLSVEKIANQSGFTL